MTFSRFALIWCRLSLSFFLGYSVIVVNWVEVVSYPCRSASFRIFATFEKFRGLTHLQLRTILYTSFWGFSNKFLVPIVTWERLSLVLLCRVFPVREFSFSPLASRLLAARSPNYLVLIKRGCVDSKFRLQINFLLVASHVLNFIHRAPFLWAKTSFCTMRFGLLVNDSGLLIKVAFLSLIKALDL